MTRSPLPAGIVDIHSRLLVNAYEPGHPARSILLDFAGNLKDRFVEAGIVDASELEAPSAAVARHIEDRDTYVISHLFVQAWGASPRDGATASSAPARVWLRRALAAPPQRPPGGR